MQADSDTNAPVRTEIKATKLHSLFPSHVLTIWQKYLYSHLFDTDGFIPMSRRKQSHREQPPAHHERYIPRDDSGQRRSEGSRPGCSSSGGSTCRAGTRRGRPLHLAPHAAGSAAAPARRRAGRGGEVAAAPRSRGAAPLNAAPAGLRRARGGGAGGGEGGGNQPRTAGRTRRLPARLKMA